MELALSLAPGPGGRLEGTVGRAGAGSGLRFTGIIELLACIEQLCEAATPLHAEQPKQL